MFFSRFIISLLVVFLASCTTTDPYSGEQKTSNTAKGAGIGALSGAILGAATSKDKKKGALTFLKSGLRPLKLSGDDVQDYECLSNSRMHNPQEAFLRVLGNIDGREQADRCGDEDSQEGDPDGAHYE